MHRRLTLVRHASAQPPQPGLSDYDRSLNAKGKKEALALGRRLAAKIGTPDLLVASPAKRALQTARILAAELAYPAHRIRMETHLYEATIADLLALISQTSDRHRHLLILGHNPGLTRLVGALTAQAGGTMPTASAFCLETTGTSWHEISKHPARILFFAAPAV